MTARTPAEEAARRRRLAALGDVSVEHAADDSDEGWSGSDGEDPLDEPRAAGLRREVPPHHG